MRNSPSSSWIGSDVEARSSRQYWLQCRVRLGSRASRVRGGRSSYAELGASTLTCYGVMPARQLARGGINCRQSVVKRHSRGALEDCVITARSLHSRRTHGPNWFLSVSSSCCGLKRRNPVDHRSHFSRRERVLLLCNGRAAQRLDILRPGDIADTRPSATSPCGGCH
jgi:hypothetical protein